MPDIYYLEDAQAKLIKLCHSGERFIIANQNESLVVAMTIGDYEALMETINVLGDLDAMIAINAAKTKRSKYSDLNLDDSNFGL
ncbi:MAG: type II toxin-antitoxin system Phd/YefM family antitoxin [Akkermansiaceae bacterium]|jgi:PHD/YefM family antitoxin component YafN of YafNO toxin-antitoxin module|nr:type II toxin-antitoxin system Phd/YefM family antitoxin [Akkermansiaceae bacterium]MDP4647886.1 type II toxin-antitoxin system Phd/YefM family antitoxin [Akkermansiaceae bacterium]MDP4719676.1 type II toxin-antitoxin system Phd/YefM family antitoxin [Akkermansiaceae bacterium]MDP4779768.1 type II toxin-antitoxin system Phd/YefM family antitoxin [Akkermansiaceae bacterium]MDP4845987.1 type II toxin-antitoxin system Phd/YefM family antitoxin [Akkermansiaceae bacterium]